MSKILEIEIQNVIDHVQCITKKLLSVIVTHLYEVSEVREWIESKRTTSIANDPCFNHNLLEVNERWKN